MTILYIKIYFSPTLRRQIIMFKKTTEYVYETISSRIKERKRKLGLKREDVLPSDEQLVSKIINNARDKKHPYLMSSSNIDDITENLNFEDTNDLLWGGINWNTISIVLLDEVIFLKNRKDEKDYYLYETLIEVLKDYVPFSVALTNAEHGIDVTEEIYKLRKEAIKRAFYNSEIDTIDEILKMQFEAEFTDSYLNKFDDRFEKFLIKFSEDYFEQNKATQNSFGIQAYNYSNEVFDHLDEYFLSIKTLESQSSCENEVRKYMALLEDYKQFASGHLKELEAFQLRFDEITIYNQNIFK